MSRVFYVLYPWAMLLLASCAGPSTPFGPVNSIGLKKKIRQVASDGFALLQNETRKKPFLNVSPGTFYVHKPFSIKIQVFDQNDSPRAEALRVEYNGYDVTDTVLKQSSFEKQSSDSAEMVIDKIKLNPTHANRIKISYLSESFGEIENNLSPPSCALKYYSPLKSTDKFQVDKSLVNEINSFSKSYGVNSFLVAGLIAQESGFNSKSISWSKAIGLTQMTPLAEKEIIHRHPDFPRYPEINDLSVLNIKSLIGLNIINDTNEWRLNHRNSINGALSYIDYLSDYWSRNEQTRLINSVYFPHEIGEQRLKLILSSYNSGPFRVKSALQEKKGDWISSSELREAKKYVGMIYSYCHSFDTNEAVYK